MEANLAVEQERMEVKRAVERERMEAERAAKRAKMEAERTQLEQRMEQLMEQRIQAQLTTFMQKMQLNAPADTPTSSASAATLVAADSYVLVATYLGGKLITFQRRQKVAADKFQPRPLRQRPSGDRMSPLKLFSGGGGAFSGGGLGVDGGGGDEILGLGGGGVDVDGGGGVLLGIGGDDGLCSEGDGDSDGLDLIGGERLLGESNEEGEGDKGNN
ncbi:heterogeneous nuclear ribonucleoprotein 87F-like [Neltuma alba]|uniref:heterogeneous nuclear ribonucleoprotein 87F-like n=1 Tax=Neltuma alba TaxID=207710 RepID=UPI0010A52BD2|nr:heterogeneous nuclear ribonucleoprotein 87F-like [Prosopis alba]